MKGEMPVNYIVAIVLAVAVLALLGYWYYTSGGKFGSSLSRQDCLTLKLKYCAEWGAKGYPTTGYTPTWSSYENSKGQSCSTSYSITVDTSKGASAC